MFTLAEFQLPRLESGEASDDLSLASNWRCTLITSRQGRSDDDLLSELLLKSGFPLTMPVEKISLAGKRYLVSAVGYFFCALIET